jgi:phosphopentomutase
VLNEFTRRTGRKVICNKPYSGTDVIRDYGDEHIKTGALIVYTSADSVFQIAAHEDIVPLEELYNYCKIAREILCGEHGVGRVIARPFKTENGKFVRTANRHDYSLQPPEDTILDILKANGKQTIAVGKIYDIFAGKGISEHIYTTGNTDGMQKTIDYAKSDFNGICFTNLVDFDMLYGHRRDIDGYANALSEFDSWLCDFLPLLKEEDILIITADHGCDPAYLATTDHTREYVPLIIYGNKVKNQNLGTRNGFCNIADMVCDYLLEEDTGSILSEILK